MAYVCQIPEMAFVTKEALHFSNFQVADTLRVGNAAHIFATLRMCFDDAAGFSSAERDKYLVR